MIVFLLDENLGRSTSEFLRSLGFTTRTVRELDLLGSRDEELLARASQERWVILTQDKDFGNLLRFPLQAHAVVVLLRLADQTPPAIRKALQRLFSQVDPASLSDALVVVSESKIRVRRKTSSS